MDQHEKKSLLVELIKLAQIDEAIKPVEYNFLLMISRQLGVGKNEFDQLFEQYISFDPPAFEFERIVQFQRLVLLMNIDLEINSKQIDFIKELGVRMGLRPRATEEVLKVMHNYPNKVVPPEKLIEIFKTFHN